MLEKSYGVTFFLKTPRKKNNLRYVYLRVTVDGIPKETSTKRKWNVNRWDQKAERAIGSKEDAKSFNFFLDSLTTKVNHYKTELINAGITITAQRIMDYVQGNTVSKAKVLEEFQAHNDEMLALVPKGEYAEGTHERYVTARSHVQDFIRLKYKRDDIEFRELNYEFIKDYEFYLKTVRNCINNTALKYISNFKKIVLRAIAKEIIPSDPFKLFKGKKDKSKKKPLTRAELKILEDKEFSTERLTVVRDVFLFQCYTGLAYIDVFQLKKTDIKTGIDGGLWIMSNRQKTESDTNIPLLPKAIEIMEKYKDHPLCVNRGSVLPVKSNQKMNEYLKEIATLCGIQSTLNTHKARRTFGSTVTLNNGVPINVVKEMLGHHSVKQTEDYAITEQETVSKQMKKLKKRLDPKKSRKNSTDVLAVLERLENDFNLLKHNQADIGKKDSSKQLEKVAMELERIKGLLL